MQDTPHWWHLRQLVRWWSCFQILLISCMWGRYIISVSNNKITEAMSQVLSFSEHVFFFFFQLCFKTSFPWIWTFKNYKIDYTDDSNVENRLKVHVNYIWIKGKSEKTFIIVLACTKNTIIIVIIIFHIYYCYITIILINQIYYVLA